MPGCCQVVEIPRGRCNPDAGIVPILPARSPGRSERRCYRGDPKHPDASHVGPKRPVDSRPTFATSPDQRPAMQRDAPNVGRSRSGTVPARSSVSRNGIGDPAKGSSRASPDPGEALGDAPSVVLQRGSDASGASERSQGVAGGVHGTFATSLGVDHASGADVSTPWPGEVAASAPGSAAVGSELGTAGTTSSPASAAALPPERRLRPSTNRLG